MTPETKTAQRIRKPVIRQTSALDVAKTVRQKLARRRQLNERWEERRTVAPVHAISLTFAEAEEVLRWLDEGVRFCAICEQQIDAEGR